MLPSPAIPSRLLSSWADPGGPVWVVGTGRAGCRRGRRPAGSRHRRAPGYGGERAGAVGPVTYVAGSGRLRTSKTTRPGRQPSANASTVGSSPAAVRAARSSVAGVSRPRVSRAAGCHGALLAGVHPGAQRAEGPVAAEAAEPLAVAERLPRRSRRRRNPRRHSGRAPRRSAGHDPGRHHAHQPGRNDPPGLSCSPMCGVTARDRATASPRPRPCAPRPAAGSRWPARSGRARSATASRRAGSAAIWISVGQVGVHGVQRRAGTATPSRSSPAASRSAIGSSPGSSEPRNAEVRPRASRSRSAGKAASSLGLAAEPGHRQRHPAGHLDGDHVVRRLDRADEREADPLAARGPDDQQGVLVDPQLGRLAAAGRRRPPPRPPPRRGRRVVAPPVAQLGQQLGAHHAEPAELDRVPVGQGDPDGERLGLGDRGDPAERDPQHASADGASTSAPPATSTSAPPSSLASPPATRSGTGRRSPVLPGRGAALAAELRAGQRRFRSYRRTSWPPPRRPARRRSSGRTSRRRSPARTTGTGRCPGRGS